MSTKLPSGYEIHTSEHVLMTAEGDALKIARAGGIHILSDRVLDTVIVDFRDNVVGALWLASDASAVTFDVAVHPDHQRRGLGRALVDLGLSRAHDHEEAGCRLELQVVSATMRSLLEKRGLLDLGQPGAILVMGRAESVVSA